MNQQAEEEDYRRYESERAVDNEKELERYKRAVEMCITGGFLKREKWEQAMKFMKEFHG